MNMRKDKLEAIRKEYASVCSETLKEEILAKEATLYPCLLSRCVKLMQASSGWVDEPDSFEYASILTKLYVIRNTLIIRKVIGFFSDKGVPTDLVMEVANNIVERVISMKVDDSWSVISNNVVFPSPFEDFVLTIEISDEKKVFIINAITMDNLPPVGSYPVCNTFDAPSMLQ